MVEKNKLFFFPVLLFISSVVGNNLNSTRTNNKFIINLENYENLQYYGSMQVGSHEQKLKMICATGSGLTWVESADCENCGDKYKYNYGHSNDFKNLSKSVGYKYAMGDIEGDIVIDSLKLADEGLSKNPNLKFLLVNKASEGLKGLQAEGVIGLGVSGVQGLERNFIMQLYDQHVISSPRFSIYIAPGKYTNSKLYIGDFSQGTAISPLYKQMTYCKVEDKAHNWECEFNSIQINTTTISTSSKIQIDTGVSYLIIPLIDYKIIKKYFVDVVKSECVRNENNQLLCKCDSPAIFPDLKLFINYSPFVINTRDLIDYAPNLSHQCRFHILIDMENDYTWTIGTSAMKNTLFSFDLSKRMLGFVQSPKNIDVFGNKENVAIDTDNEEDSNKIGFAFTLFFLILIMVGLYKCADNQSFLNFRTSNSLNSENNEDKKKMELIKNKFNTEEYDYDFVNNDTNTGRFNTETKTHNIEMKEIPTDKK